MTIKTLVKWLTSLRRGTVLVAGFIKIKISADATCFRDFLKTNPEIPFRTPKAISAARARGLNQESVVKYFSVLDEIVSKNNITPIRMYNMDELGIQTSQNFSMATADRFFNKW